MKAEDVSEFHCWALVIRHIVFQEIYEIKAQNPHNAKASETKPLLSTALSWQCAAWVFKAVPATPQDFTGTLHIVLFEVSIRASTGSFGDLRGSL